MTLKQLKSYLRIDTDEDDAILHKMMDAAEEYIVNAVGEYDDSKARMEMLHAAIVQDMYDNRTFVASSTQGYAVSENMRHMVLSMIRQLQIECSTEE